MKLPTKPHYQFVTLASGLKIQYSEFGNPSNPPVLFLQGSGPGASAWLNFRYNVEYFANNGFRVILPDLPGFGDSDKPDLDYTLDFFVASMTEFADLLDLEKFAIVGNSLGGAIALGIELAHPERVSRLILMGCGGLEETVVYFTQMEGIKAMTKIPLGSPEFTPEYLKEVLMLIVFDPKHITDELIAERFRILKTQIAAVFTRMRIPNMSARLSDVKAPILGFWGAQDRFCPISGARTIVENAAKAQMITLSQCGHWVMIEYPDLFNKASVEFLKS